MNLPDAISVAFLMVLNCAIWTRNILTILEIING